MKFVIIIMAVLVFLPLSQVQARPTVENQELTASRADDNSVEVSGADDNTPPRRQQPTGQSVSLNNPLGNQTLLGFFKDIIAVILVFAVPIIVFFIILAGFTYVTAGGKPDQISKASRALLFAIIGGILILGAWIILEVIQGTINAFTA